jgi:hypothetical protein
MNGPPSLYILTPQKQAVEVKDFAKWSHWYSTSPHRNVAHTLIKKFFVWTIFTGMDCPPDPLLFETKILDKNEFLLVNWRTVLNSSTGLRLRPPGLIEETFVVCYEQYKDAIQGHKHIVEALKA